MRLFDSSYPLIALSPQPSSSGAATEPWLCNKVRSCPAIKRKALTSLTPETLRLTASAHATGSVGIQLRIVRLTIPEIKMPFWAAQVIEGLCL